ncbi:hypothetical protein Patl1_09814 [Pistacia atlantica]|uniref:Uncharacterized protein n=1 Tax=Pistacia atlantica TaxID=434234 RepID=A0ACC1A6A6_9ROSI|nr:hypothetical protein Patl1_09814 [Pistacia atlantica]
MGGMLSKNFSRRQQCHPEAKAKAEEEAEAEAVSSNDANDKSKSTQGSISIIELMKPECFKTKRVKRKRSMQSLKQPEKKIMKPRKLTLEEWLLNSPAPDNFNNNNKTDQCFSGGELYVFKHSSRRVHPSLSSSSSTTTTVKMHREAEAAAAAPSTSRPRDSFNCSLDISANSCSSLSRSQSGKSKKRVSFRLPEEADIIIFYSPEDTLGSDHQSF